MDGLTAVLVAVILAYGLRAKESRERIQLLGGYLQAFEIERLLEQLHTGYQRALNESQAGTRELIPHESYRLVYEIEGTTVWVLALVHTARQWPPAR